MTVLHSWVDWSQEGLSGMLLSVSDGVWWTGTQFFSLLLAAFYIFYIIKSYKIDWRGMMRCWMPDWVTKLSQRVTGFPRSDFVSRGLPVDQGWMRDGTYRKREGLLAVQGGVIKGAWAVPGQWEGAGRGKSIFRHKRQKLLSIWMSLDRRPVLRFGVPRLSSAIDRNGRFRGW